MSDGSDGSDKSGSESEEEEEEESEEEKSGSGKKIRIWSKKKVIVDMLGIKNQN